MAVVYITVKTIFLLQWDDWHSLNALEKNFVKEFGKIKIFQDKIVALRSHVYWCLRECKISLEEYQDEKTRTEAILRLQNAILNCTRHWQGTLPDSEDENGVKFHENCSKNARCQTQVGYVLRKDYLTKSEANLLRNFLLNSVFIKNTEKYLLGSNTSNVESSHRGQNVYRFVQLNIV